MLTRRLPIPARYLPYLELVLDGLLHRIAEQGEPGVEPIPDGLQDVTAGPVLMELTIARPEPAGLEPAAVAAAALEGDTIPRRSLRLISGDGFHCAECGEEMPLQKRRRHATVCSRACFSSRRKRWQLEHTPNALRGANLSSGTTGALHELVVAADLLRLGFQVFRALSPSCPCDLLILRGQRILRIEVTTATRNRAGGYSHPKSKVVPGVKFDHLAVVWHAERHPEIIYEPPLPEPEP